MVWVDSRQNIVFSTVQQLDLDLNRPRTFDIGGIFLQQATFAKFDGQIVHIFFMHCIFGPILLHCLLLSLIDGNRRWIIILISIFFQKCLLIHSNSPNLYFLFTNEFKFIIRFSCTGISHLNEKFYFVSDITRGKCHFSTTFIFTGFFIVPGKFMLSLTSDEAWKLFLRKGR